MQRKLVEPPSWNMGSDIRKQRCALCGRLIPQAQRDMHHLVPKMKGGKETVAMHRICHRQIHALFSETELARRFSTPEALLTSYEIKRFVDWVRTKPDNFFERTRRSSGRQ
jgi:5-methylcytosine-specific restriction endonuclease McrA